LHFLRKRGQVVNPPLGPTKKEVANVTQPT
jgi:hypothetical protein